MNKVTLNNPMQVAALAATHAFEIRPTDLDTATTVNTDLTLTLMSVPAGSVILAARAVLLQTYGTASADTTLAVSVGVNGATANVLAAKTIVNAGTASAAPLQWAGNPNVSVDTASNLTVTFDITDVDGKLSDVNSGVLRVYVWIKRAAEEQNASF
jgi:hypothetical protein